MDFLDNDKIQGVGYICKALGEVIVKEERNHSLALTDFFKGLGKLGVHTNILSAMQAPDGQVAAVFQAPPEVK